MDELIKQVIAGFPSFTGLIIAIVLQYRANERLMVLLERLCKPCVEEEEAQGQ